MFRRMTPRASLTAARAGPLPTRAWARGRGDSGGPATDSGPARATTGVGTAASAPAGLKHWGHQAMASDSRAPQSEHVGAPPWAGAGWAGAGWTGAGAWEARAAGGAEPAGPPPESRSWRRRPTSRWSSAGRLSGTW